MNRNFTAICATFLLCAILIVFYASMAIAKSPVALADSNGGTSKVVYLTFDDGPSDRVTPLILDVLKEENVRATFFIIGKNAKTRRNLIKREVDEGHTVAVHSYSHDYKKIYASPESLLKDVDECNDVLFDIIGKKSYIYRFPGGSYGLSDTLIRAVTMHGMRYVDWNASTCDAEICEPTAEQLFKCAIATPVNPECVVLLAHDSTTKTTTAEALKDVIHHYKSKGYRFCQF